MAVSFDLLAEDPLEWLIETDCSQQYLPESSLPLFPFLQDDEDDDDKLGLPQDDTDDDDEEHIQDERPDNAVASSDNVMMIKTDMVEDALLNNMVDANVTMQSLFLTAVEDRETTERQ